MPTTEANELLRPGLLEGVRIVLAGGPGDGEAKVASAVAGTCAGLGGRVLRLPSGAGSPPEPEEDAFGAAVEQALVELGGIDMLLVDAADPFGSSRPVSGREALVGCLEATWSVTRAVATRAFIEPGRGGRIVYVAPAPVGGGGRAEAEEHHHVQATCAALENLARTLSIEWARYGITTVSIAPGGGTTACEEVAALAAYLASPAGGYFSGCLLDLRANPERV